MEPKKIVLREKLDLFDEYWSPKVIGELNDFHVKLAKLKGEFVWHQHEKEDELFFVLKGCLVMKFRDGEVTVNENEVLIVPRGVEHLPVAVDDVHVLLVEPRSTVNTGDAVDERTVAEPERI